MPFGVLTHVGSSNHVLDGVQMSPAKGALLRGTCRIVTYLNISALRPQRANVPAERTHSLPRGVTGDAALCQITLDTCVDSEITKL